MTGKITIRGGRDGWHVTRPGYGFGRPTETIYRSFAAAVRSLSTGPGVASAWSEKANYTMGLWLNGRRSTRAPYIRAEVRA